MADADKLLELKKDHWKGYYRKGQVYSALN